MHCRRVPCLFVLFKFLLLCAGAGMEPAHAQLDSQANAWRPAANDDLGVMLTLREETLHARPDASSRCCRSSPHIGRAFLGSTIGVGAGVGIGLLLVKGAAEGSPEGEPDNWQERQASDTAAMMTLIGVAAMAAGGPFGAVRGAGIERNRRDVYVGAGAGELVVGLLGYALARRLHDSTPSRLIGLGTGMAVGSTAGAVWVALAQAEDDGLFSYQNGRWQVSTPDVQVRPHLTTNRSPSMGVTVLTARF